MLYFIIALEKDFIFLFTRIYVSKKKASHLGHIEGWWNGFPDVYAERSAVWNQASGIFTRFVDRMRQKLLHWRPQYRTIYDRRYARGPKFRVGMKGIFSRKLYNPVFAGHPRNWKFYKINQMEWMLTKLVYLFCMLCLKLHSIEK